MHGYFRIIPEYIATHKYLSAEQKIFYGLFLSLITKYGFCWASNRFLAEASSLSPRTIQRYIRHFVKHNLLIIELQHHNDRKIWSPETWGNRENLLRAYGESIINSKSNSQANYSRKLNQRFCGYDSCDVGGTTTVSPPPIYNVYKEKDIKNKNTERAEAQSKNSHIFSQDKQDKEEGSAGKKDRDWKKPSREDVVLLKPSLQDKPPPTPGPKAMVDQVKEIVDRPIRIGSKRVLINARDRAYFYGFSPLTVEEGIERVNRESKKGTKIHNIPAMIFKTCAEIRKG